MLGLLETKWSGAGELGDNIRYGSRGDGTGDIRQRQETVKSWGVGNALVVGQDGSNRESSIIIIQSNNGLIGRVLFGLLHKVEVCGEDVVSLT